MILVTGSRGHLGEALMRTFRQRGIEARGIDRLPSPYTTLVGSIADLDFVRDCMRGVDGVIHAATLHKPHVATHSRQAFVDTNITGTLNILEAALENQVSGVIFTSTTSTFGAALQPDSDSPAAWITEAVAPIPKNIYGVTKVAAEDLCELFYRSKGLPCLVLRTSRFFPEPDDNADQRAAYDDLNLKVNEFLHRRVELSDVVSAHLLALEKVAAIGFDRFIISATKPFQESDMARLRTDAAAVVAEYYPQYADIFRQRGWQMYTGMDRVYVNAHAREVLGWNPQFDFGTVLDRLASGESVFSELAQTVGSKGYHATDFGAEPYPVEG